MFAGLQSALNPLRVPELKQLCKEHGLDNRGTKTQLIARLANQGKPKGKNAGGSPPKNTAPESPALVNPRPTSATGSKGASVASPSSKVKTGKHSSSCGASADVETKANACLSHSFTTMDPFNPVEPEGILRCQVVKASKVKFQLDAPGVQQWRKQGQNIEMRMCQLKSKGAKEQVKQAWPHEMRFVNNGNLVFEVCAPEAGHKRRDVPQVISAGLRSGANLVELTISDDNAQSFAFAIVRTKPCTPQQLFLEVPSIDKQAGQKRAKELMGSISRGDGEVQCLGTDRTRLLCPITMVRPDKPARGKQCRHLQCFDLMAFLESNQQMKAINNRWSCPVCSHNLKPNDLCIDLFTADILARTGKDVDEVVIKKDGKWSVNGKAQPVNSVVSEEVDDGIDLLASPLRTKRCSAGSAAAIEQVAKKPRTAGTLADAVSNAVFPEALKARRAERTIAPLPHEAHRAEERAGSPNSPIAID